MENLKEIYSLHKLEKNSGHLEQPTTKITQALRLAE